MHEGVIQLCWTWTLYSRTHVYQLPWDTATEGKCCWHSASVFSQAIETLFKKPVEDVCHLLPMTSSTVFQFQFHFLLVLGSWLHTGSLTFFYNACTYFVFKPSDIEQAWENHGRHTWTWTYSLGGQLCMLTVRKHQAPSSTSVGLHTHNVHGASSALNHASSGSQLWFLGFFTQECCWFCESVVSIQRDFP